MKTILFPQFPSQLHNVPDKFEEDEAALRILRSTFGDVLVRVYKRLNTIVGENQGFIANVGYQKTPCPVKTNGDLDSNDVVLEFSNGKFVLFTSSEWASLVPVPVGAKFN